MKFGLRFVILFSLVTGTTIGLYFMEMNARKGIRIEVERHTQLQNEGIDVPVMLLEFRSGKNVRELEKASGSYLRSRMEECCQDFRDFHQRFHYSEELLETYPDEIRAAAESALDHGSFETAVDAAWALNKLGSKSCIKQILERFQKERERDREQYWRLFNFLKEERVTDLDPAVVTQVKKVADSDSNSAANAAELLFECDIDKEPLYRLLSKNKVSMSTLEWLVRNAPSEQVAEAVDEWINTEPEVSYSTTELFAAVLQLPPQDPTFESVRGKVETFIAESYQGLKYDDDRNERLRLLIPHATNKSIPVVEKLLADCDQFDFRSSLLTLLHRLGETESAKQHFLRLWDKFKKEFESYRGSHLKHELLRIAPPILGVEETVELCIECDSGISLAEFVEDTRAKGAVDRLKTDTKTLTTARNRAIEYLKNDTKGSNSYFYRNWFHTELSRQKVVDWINVRFKPTTPLTVDQVLINDRYPEDHGLWLTWSRLDHRVTDIHTFLLVALAHSGRGHLAHWEYTHPEMICDSIEEFAAVDRLNEYKVGAHFEDGGYPQEHSIVVNQRVYKFHVSEGPNGSDERYDVGAIVDIMNSIAIRQRLRRRFFVFETLPEKGYCLVMFLSPKEASDISDTFGISPDRGTSDYLEN